MPRHAGKLRRFRVLCDAHAAHGLDGLRARGAIGTHAAQDHRYRAFALLLRQALEEVIDGTIGGMGTIQTRTKLQAALHELEDMRGANDINVIRLHGHPVIHLQHGHLGLMRQDLGHQAMPIGGEMQDENERHPAIGAHGSEEFAECLQPTSAGADADDHKRQLRRRFSIDGLCVAVGRNVGRRIRGVG